MLLTMAARIDPRMKRVDPNEQADMATAWATVLDDVTLEDAIAAARAHYRSDGTRTLTPADIVAHAESALRSASDAGNVTELRLARESRGEIEPIGGLS